MSEKFRVEVSDTITYTRTKVIEVEADDEEDAQNKAIDIACDADTNWFKDMDEEQTDNTPWEAAIVYAHRPNSCPSNHNNNGRDICSDCGKDLNWSEDDAEA